MTSENPSPPERPRSVEEWLGALGEAAAFHTRLPLGRAGKPRWAVGATAPVLPVLGLGIGLAVGLAFALAHWLGAALPLAAALALLFGVALTGALHEDGLADTADAFGPAGIDAPRRLEIMRDSRIGVFGAIALILSFAIRAAALVDLGPTAGLLALGAAHALSRAAIAAPLARLEPARGDGLGAGCGRAGDADAGMALAIGAGLAFLLLLGKSAGAAVLAPAAAVAVTWAGMQAMKRRIGGYTGDTLGALQQATEIAVLVVCALCIATAK